MIFFFFSVSHSVIQTERQLPACYSTGKSSSHRETAQARTTDSKNALLQNSA